MSAGAQIDYDALAQQHGGNSAVDYDSLATQHGGTAASVQGVPTGTISATPPWYTPEGARERLATLYSNLTNQGGLDSGAAKIITSPLSGPVRMAAGALNLSPSGQRQSGRDIGMGALDSMQIPGSFVAPEAGEAIEGIPQAVQDARTALQVRRAAALANDTDEWQRINSVLKVPAKSIRISPTAEDLSEAATMPGRTLSRMGLTSDVLNKMEPLQQANAISQRMDVAGQAVSAAADKATQAGITLDAGKSALASIKRIDNPQIQDRMIQQFNDVAHELRINDFENATPAEAWKLRKALQEKPGLMSLARAVNQDLVAAAPDMKPTSQAYSDLVEGRNAAMMQVKKAAASAPPPTMMQSAIDFLKTKAPARLAKAALYGAGATGGGATLIEAAKALGWIPESNR